MIRLEALVDLVFFPEVRLQILHPLEIRYRDAAGIGENIGQHHDAALEQDVVGFRKRRPVGRFGDDRAP